MHNRNQLMCPYNPELFVKLCQKYKIQYKTIAKELGIAPPTITRIAQGKYGIYEKSGQQIEIIVKYLRKRGVSEAYDILRPTPRKIGKLTKKKPQEEKEMIDKVLKFWKIQENPFHGGCVNTKGIYYNEQFLNYRDVVVHAATNDQFLSVTGVTGTGKSTVLEAALEKLEKIKKLKILRVSALDPSKVDANYIMHSILINLGDGKVPRGQVKKNDKLSKVLQKYKKNDIKIAMVLDEAQDLPPKTLKLLKKFWVTYGVHQGKMAVILVGQQGLDYTMDLISMAEVQQRIYPLELNPMITQGNTDSGEVEKYIAHKLQGTEITFTPDAITVITERTDTPQEINALCTDALTKAAQIGHNKPITGEIIGMV